jgi:hypothetical protein
MVTTLLICAAAIAATAVALTATRGEPRHDARPVTDPAELTRLGADALALVNVDPKTSGYGITFAPGRDGVRAQTDRSTKTISVYLRDGDLPHVVAHDIGHELGHVYDQSSMDAATRAAYLEHRGVAGAAWLPDGASDYAVGAGDFAEVYALCHAASPDFRSELAPRPESPCDLLPAGAR